MGEMFDNYPQPNDYIPDNRHRCIKHNELTIMAGESSSHSFDVPFNVEEQMSNFSVIYKLGLKVVVVKEQHELEVVYDEEHNKTIITCDLNPMETALFRDTLLTAQVQLKFITKEINEVSYSEIYTIKLLDSLEV